MKKLSALFICLLLVITCGLAGCAGFYVNRVKYYNEVLVTVGSTEITRHDLLSAYNSYGYNYYVVQRGLSEEEALKSTLDLLIDRESLYLYALDNNETYKPTTYQVNVAVEEVFNSIDSQMDSYIEKAKTILNIKTDEIEAEEEKDEESKLYENYVYKKRAKLVETDRTYYTTSEKETVSSTPTEFYDVEYEIKYNIEDEEPETYTKLIDERFLNDFTSNATISEIKAKYLARYKANLEIEEKENATKIYNKTLSLFTSDLIDYERYFRNENGDELSKTTDDLIFRYVERTFDSQIKSTYLENLRTKYLSNPELLDLALLEQEFQTSYAVDYQAYSFDSGIYKDKMKNIGTAGDTVLYHPDLNNENVQFGYFIHTLIGFSEEQKAEIKALDNIIEEDKKEIEYQNIVLSETKAKARDAETGIIPEDAEEISLQDLIAEYNLIKAEQNTQVRMEKFIEFMFKYTTDTATLSSGMPYVVGTNGNSAMEEAFTKESIKLMETGNKKEMSNIVYNDLDSMCITSYGIHLIMYVDDVNAFDIAHADTQKVYFQENNRADDESGLNLYTKIINPLTHKTYFDLLFDKVYPASSGEVYTSNSEYTSYEKKIIRDSQASHKVVKYTTKIDKTTASL